MRAHGVPDFPDPNGNGQLLIQGGGNGSDLNPSSPQFQAAQNDCKSLAPGGLTARSGTKNRANALKFSECMRKHGITNFPDPTVQDNPHEKGVGFSMPAGVDDNSPQFKSAAKSCQKLTGFGHPSPAVLQALMAAGVKFAECMRSHGIANYPDPVEHGSNIQLGPGPDSGFDMNSPTVKAAQKACNPLLPNGGP